MEIRRLVQQDQVAAENDAPLRSAVAAVLTALLDSTSHEILEDHGGRGSIKLRGLAARRVGTGDLGISFEYVIHDALKRGDAEVLERLIPVLREHCKLEVDQSRPPKSLLFGAEKALRRQLVDLPPELRDGARVLAGNRGQPPLLAPALKAAIEAHRYQGRRNPLASSISGLWKADLFLGAETDDRQRWIATTLKSNPSDIESHAGLRLGIVLQRREGSQDEPYDVEGLRVVPIPYDTAFQEVLHQGFALVGAFLNAGAREPRRELVPNLRAHRMTTELAGTRDAPVVEVIEILSRDAQVGLMRTESQTVEVAQVEDPSDEPADDAPDPTLEPTVVLAPTPRRD